MSYIINYDEARNLFAQATTDVGSWSDLYSSIKTSFEGLVSNEDFTGSGADQIKQYISEVHLTVCYAIETIATEYMSRFLLFLEGLYTYDTDIHAVLCEEDMTTLITNMENVLGGIEDIHPRAVTTSSEMSDIITSSISTLVDNYVSTLYDKKEELVSSRDEIGEYDHDESAVGMANLKSLVADILGIVDALREGGVKNIATYESGSIIGLEELNSIYEKMTISQQYVYDNQENIEAAYKHLEQVYEQIEEELAEERWKQGLAAVFTAGLYTVLVISTAGMFSPLFFATFGVASGLYNISNGVQGIQDVYYGLSGDAYTESWNPGEALFESAGLPPESYHVFGMVTTGVYTIAVPVKQYCTAGTSANMLMTKQQAFGNVLVDAGVDYGTTYICEQCGVDELTTMLMGVSMGTLAGFGGSVRDVDLPNLKSNKSSGNVANLVDEGYKTSYGKSSENYKSTADFLTNVEYRNGKYYADKTTIDEIGQIEARGEDFSLLNKKIMSSRPSTEGGTSIVYKYSDDFGTKYLIHEVTDADGYIIHRDFDAVKISSGQLINKGY